MTSDSKKPITVITKFTPMATRGGSYIRIGATVRALANRRPVKVILITSPYDPPWAEGLSQLEASGLDCSAIAEAELSTAGRWRRLFADLTAMVAPGLANRMLPQFGHSAIDEHDGDLWVFKSTLLDGRRLPEKGQVIVDLDDLEERTLQLRCTIPHLLHRLHLVSQRRRAVAIASVALVCSARDRRRLHRHSTIDVLPNTYLLREEPPPIPTSRCEPIVAMVGRMAYRPNREGAEWFATECWPLIRSRIPTARCRLMGEGAHVLDSLAGNGLEIIDDVPDPIAFLNDVAVIAAPIFRGSGTRVKILEAMALGIPVVSTQVGAEGLEVTDGVDILLGDSPEAFAGAVARLLANPELANDIGQRGTEVFDALYRFDRFQVHINRILDHIE